MTFATEELTACITNMVLDGRLDIEGAVGVDMKMNVASKDELAVMRKTLDRHAAAQGMIPNCQPEGSSGGRFRSSD